MPHFIAKRWPNGDLDIIKRESALGDRVHVFTDAEIGRDGHWPLVYDADNQLTHVAIPVEQYVRIFGEL